MNQIKKFSKLKINYLMFKNKFEIQIPIMKDNHNYANIIMFISSNFKKTYQIYKHKMKKIK